MGSSRAAVSDMQTESVKFEWVVNKLKHYDLLYRNSNKHFIGPKFVSNLFNSIHWCFSLNFHKDSDGPCFNLILKIICSDCDKEKAMDGILKISKSDGIEILSEKFYRWVSHNSQISLCMRQKDIISESIKIVADFSLIVHDKESDLKYTEPLAQTSDGPSAVEQLSDAFESLLSSDPHHDFTVCVQDETFQGHRAVFAARSPVFRAMFEHPMKQRRTSEVQIDDTSPETWRLFQRFLYTARLSFDGTDVALGQALLLLADKYGVESLSEEVATRLGSALTKDNVLEVLELAERFRKTRLEDAAVDVFWAHIAYLRSEKEEALESCIQSCPRLVLPMLKSVK